MSSLSTLPRLLDVDCNLWHKDLKSFKLQSKENGVFDILQEDAIKESNIVAMLSPSSTLAEAELGLKALCTTTPIPIKTTVGVHPYHAQEEGTPNSTKMAMMEKLIVDNPNKVAAVGECGLDTSEGFPPLQDQIPWFQAQVQLANQLKLPLFVHERFAFDETLECLNDSTKEIPIIIHCFTGTREQCREYVNRGYSISVSGFICKNDGKEVQACLEEGIIPLDKLMVETDAPYMGFDNCRARYVEKHADIVATLNGKKRKRLSKSIYPNVPSSLPFVVDKVVECLNKGRQERKEALLERNEVAEQMTRNAIEFFGFDI